MVLKSSNAAALSGIVFLSITVTHVTDASPWIFAWYRASETLVGIAVGIAVNAFQLPRRKRRDVLFVSGLDGLLLTEQGTLTPYSRVSLNRMLDDGMQFTLSTMRTPASVREATRDLRLRLPVIVMDGAALYDMEKKRYLHACVLPRELALRCEVVFRVQGIHCFLNGVLDDNLMIYYGEFHHETERAIFEKLRTSPYRNYVSRSYYKDCPIVYLMGIDLTERMQALYDALGEAGLKLEDFDAFVGRGGGLLSLPGGTYAINEVMLEHARIGANGIQHPAQLGPQIAHEFCITLIEPGTGFG